MPKKIGGLNQKQAIILFVVVAAGVFFYLRHKNTNAAASVSAPSADQTASPYPAQASDSTGGASSAGAQDPALAELLNQFATTPPYYYYNTGNNSTTTTNYYGQAATTGDATTTDTGHSQPPIDVKPATSPASTGGDPFKPTYNVPKTTTTYANPGFLAGTVGPAQPIKGPTIFAFK